MVYSECCALRVISLSTIFFGLTAYKVQVIRIVFHIASMEDF